MKTVNAHHAKKKESMPNRSYPTVHCEIRFRHSKIEKRSSSRKPLVRPLRTIMLKIMVNNRREASSSSIISNTKSNHNNEHPRKLLKNHPPTKPSNRNNPLYPKADCLSRFLNPKNELQEQKEKARMAA